MTEQYSRWFPGHMSRAVREIRERFSMVDVFIELLDGRAPFSSSNSMLAELRRGKPCLKVLTKADLSDPKCNDAWQSHYEADKGIKALLADARNRRCVSPVPGLCRKLYIASGGRRRKITAMVTGIANVGKSTLINSLAGRAVEKTGSQPAVTRQQRFVELNRDFTLVDTPGLTPPAAGNENSGYRLALTGAIADTAVPHQTAALFAIAALKERCRTRIADRYGIRNMDVGSFEILTEIGRRRGCLSRGGAVDATRAARIVIADIRGGRLGRITWETPEMIAAENRAQPRGLR